MRLRKFWVLFVLFMLCLAFDAWVYGSLALEPDIGPPLASAARVNAPLMYGYIALGRPLVARAGAAAGQQVADTAFGAAYPSISAMPAVADGLLFSESRGPLRAILIVLFWGAPVLLVLTLVTWVLRSRDTHLMGRVRR